MTNIEEIQKLEQKLEYLEEHQGWQERRGSSDYDKEQVIKKKKAISERLKYLRSIQQQTPEERLKSFLAELTELSKDYGIAVHSDGGVFTGGNFSDIEYQGDHKTGSIRYTIEHETHGPVPSTYRQ